MGQYHYICNWTRREYLNPHAFGESLTLKAIALGKGGTLTALCYLLSHPEKRSRADFTPGPKYAGRWRLDALAIVGDYARDNDLPEYNAGSDGPHDEEDRKGWVDISGGVYKEINEYNPGLFDELEIIA